ncbi:MAPEG family protein [Denitrobaculum tricleocarpae]|uniref:MAPEG family protein n=1 Tax=Denitrobaculum tricleocarpae TaxID=2591009 RepID=A0A545TF14_9PROT|nr:MAPEG family protein [Denitrobaculum tricleocarpae]TQV75824.1 MAPEG family protein [Denitrobaculum tricleocarpae]
MPQEIFWLAATALMTALFWAPYTMNRMAVRGLMRTLGNPAVDDAPHADWAERSIKAHKNGVENFTIFAPLALAVVALGIGDALTGTACMVYFFARLAHFVVYTAGIPGLRTIAFTVGFIVQALLALRVMGLM